MRHSPNASQIFRLVITVLGFLPFTIEAQDIPSVLDKAPFAARILLSVLDKTQPFTAKMEVTLSVVGDPNSSVASGPFSYDTGKLRWDVKLADIRAAELTANARALVRQVNGERFMVIVRSDEKSNSLVLPGVKACLHQSVPDAKLTRTKLAAKTEQVDNRACLREQWRVAGPDKAEATVTTWKLKGGPGTPIQIQVKDTDQVISFHLTEVRQSRAPAERFRVPEGVSRYRTLEDMTQSILLDKMRRRLGLQ